ncbi:MAG: cyclase family protein [Planctomycetota bacterium]|nr:cyclase family protein [Planctomycetota bacterium]
MALFELSHVIEDGMTTYPGLPGPLVCDYLTREASREHYSGGATFHIGKVEMIANTGTYVDAPFHRYADGLDIAELPLERLAHLRGICVDATEVGRVIGPEVFDGLELAGRAVLVRTGWDRHWREERYAVEAPHLTEDAARLLFEAGVSFVGIDSLNVDAGEDGRRPVHSLLLANGIPIGEHLTGFAALPPEGFRFHAAPARVRGLGTFPVRAYAVTE